MSTLGSAPGPAPSGLGLRSTWKANGRRPGAEDKIGQLGSSVWRGEGQEEEEEEEDVFKHPRGGFSV